MTTTELERITREMRKDIVRVSHESHSGHVGSAMSIIDILAVLYFQVMKLWPKNPWAVNRDRFILSKGHAALALYIVLAYRSFFSKKLLPSFVQDGSLLVGHPEGRTLPGVEATTGSLGHGLSVGVGMALAGKLLKKNYRVFVLLSDAECDEGEVWEAAMFAAQHRLDNLVAIVDYNKLQAFGNTEEVLDLKPLKAKWQSFRWAVKEIDGHNMKELERTFKKTPFNKGRPSMVIAHTKMGKGVSFMEDQLAWHYLDPTDEHLENALRELQ